MRAVATRFVANESTEAVNPKKSLCSSAPDGTFNRSAVQSGSNAEFGHESLMSIMLVTVNSSLDFHHLSVYRYVQIEGD